MAFLKMFLANDVFTLTGVACNINRLNYRYSITLQPIKNLLKNAVVLDMGSHNGRWTYVALNLGAKYVIGLEQDKSILQTAFENIYAKGFNQKK